MLRAAAISTSGKLAMASMKSAARPPAQARAQAPPGGQAPGRAPAQAAPQDAQRRRQLADLQREVHQRLRSRFVHLIQGESDLTSGSKGFA